MTNFYLVNIKSCEEIHITQKEFTIGRAMLANCTDKRISRKHGIITINDNGLHLKAIHINPFFLVRSPQQIEKSSIQLIHKNTEIQLNKDDKIGFLQDEFWFRVGIKSLENNEDTQSTITANTPDILLPSNENKDDDEEEFIQIDPAAFAEDDVADNVDSPSDKREGSSSSNGPTTFRILNVAEINASTTENVNDDTDNAAKRKLPNWMFSEGSGETSSPKKHRTNNENDGDKNNETSVDSNAAIVTNSVTATEPVMSVKQITMDSVAANPVSSTPSDSNSTISAAVTTPLPVVKKEPDTADSEQTDDGIDVAAGPSNPNSSTVVKTGNVKQEAADSSTPSLRVSCQFGIKCYRRNPQHRADAAHPGDADYRRPNFPPAPPDAPDCPFSTACYRRNPQHFQAFRHPPSTNPKVNRHQRRRDAFNRAQQNSSQSQPSSQDLPIQRKRKKQPVNYKEPVTDNSEDPFSVDSDESDDWQPSQNDDYESYDSSFIDDDETRDDDDD